MNLISQTLSKCVKPVGIFLLVTAALMPAHAKKSAHYTSQNNQAEAINKDDVITMLQEMQSSVKNKDYKLTAVLNKINRPLITLEYQHLGSSLDLSRVVFLEGAKREIILKDSKINYFNENYARFAVNASYVTEVFPPIVYANYHNLTAFYDFIALGKSRTANRLCQLIRVVPKVHDRHNYILWIDEASKLPLRIDLFNEESLLIKQFKTVSLIEDFDKKAIEDDINAKTYPQLLQYDKTAQRKFLWRVNWLPDGFKEHFNYNNVFEQQLIDTKLFTDGVFTFTVSVSDTAKTQSEQLFERDERVIYTVNDKNKNIVIIGDLPIQTLKKIAQSISIK